MWLSNFQLSAHNIDVFVPKFNFKDLSDFVLFPSESHITTSNVKLFKKTIQWDLSEFNYTYKRFKTYYFGSNESHDYYHEDGHLVPSPQCGFCFEAAFHLNTFHRPRRLHFPTKFVILSLDNFHSLSK